MFSHPSRIINPAGLLTDFGELPLVDQKADVLYRIGS